MLQHIGVDVAKKTLAVHDGEGDLEIANSPSAIARWLEGLEGPARIAMESTGIYGRLLARLAMEAGHEVFVLPPKWILDHMRSAGARAKTDRVDARAIQRYIARPPRELRPSRPMDEDLVRIVELRRERRALGQDIARIRMRSAGRAELPEVRALLDQMEACLKSLDRRIRDALEPRELSAVIQSIPGFALQGAAELVPVMEHRDFRTADELAAFCGLDPAARESGAFKGPRRISKKGDPALRTAFYMAAVGACNSKAFKPLFLKLKERMKPKQALVALARKLLKILHALCRRKEMFDPQKLAFKL